MDEYSALDFIATEDLIEEIHKRCRSSVVLLEMNEDNNATKQVAGMRGSVGQTFFLLKYGIHRFARDISKHGYSYQEVLTSFVQPPADRSSPLEEDRGQPPLDQ